ncbi:MAG TPA: type 2 lanthipeptide synthetase LanM family protein [Pyrinomonadaceae bacterium]|jgi:type 2 lantibiotic biosynthesis protein LanM|nr:type 2 lanthipeptide synthetase LanM family protein [Pyrinomonadaceae bacterium]
MIRDTARRKCAAEPHFTGDDQAGAGLASDEQALIDLSILEDACWFKALTLAERAASLLSAGGPATLEGERAERLAARWRGQHPFSDDSIFAARLEACGLDEPGFLRLLGESVEALRRRVAHAPAWLSEYREAFFPRADDAHQSGGPGPTPDEASARTEMGFLLLAEPLIARAMRRLREGVGRIRQTRGHIPFDPESVMGLLVSGFDLPGRLLNLLGRTLILELNVARLQGSLRGETPQQRFHCFLNDLGRREKALGIFREYPVIARRLVECLDNWVSFGLEFLQRLSDDWEALRANIWREQGPRRLEAVQSDVGDTHRGGRSVVIASFDSGLKLVYKPRPLSIDCHFNEVLRWLNERGGHPPFRTLRILDRGSYGWVEFVKAEGCDTESEVRRFYERQGGHLALLYALEAVDIHLENLIAAGEHPVLIDLEALFNPLGGMERDAGPLADRVLARSVMSVGLLPQRIWGGEGAEGVEVSGLGGSPDQPMPGHSYSLENPATDEMRVRTEQGKTPAGQNRPRLAGAEVNPQDYADDIVDGFTSVYRLLLKHRDELLSEGGPLDRFAGDEVRVIFRPTQTYGLMLQDSSHPDMLRDALDCDRLFDRLWSEVPKRPYLKRIIPAECADLHRGDIPLLTARPGARDLYTSTNERIADFFDEPSINQVRARLRELGEEDLTRQIWFIRASLTCLTKGEGTSTGLPPKELLPPADREQLLAGARAVGDRLEMLSLREGECASWIGVNLVGGRFWSLLPLGVDLYDGVAGVALFLAYLGAVTGEGRYTALAKSGVTTLVREVESMLSEPARAPFGVGAFTGWGGVVYALTHLGVLWEEPSLLARAEAVADVLSRLIEEENTFDIIGGSAGCACVLAGLYRVTSSPRVLKMAALCGNRLVGGAKPMTEGVAWEASLAGTKPLTGFSHGAAGAAYALLVLAALTGDASYRRVALDALAYERSHFSPADDNWADLRQPDAGGDGESPGYALAWCHGAPGIGLARIRSLLYLDDAEARADIRSALRATLRAGFGSSHCLCHGDLGNSELFLEAAAALNQPRLRDLADRVAATVLGCVEQTGWLCGTPLNVETPGLMTGLAGIGYNLLRLAEPARVPSVLCLAPPPPYEL